MINEAYARTQIMRLSRLQYFPAGEDEAALRSDLVNELRRAATNEAAKEIVYDWLVEATVAPTVSELRGIVSRRLSPKAIGCEKCKMTGWILRQHENSQPSATPCGCRK